MSRAAAEGSTPHLTSSHTSGVEGGLGRHGRKFWVHLYWYCIADRTATKGLTRLFFLKVASKPASTRQKGSNYSPLLFLYFKPE